MMLGAAATAAAVYLLDPRSGSVRRGRLRAGAERALRRRREPTEPLPPNLVPTTAEQLRESVRLEQDDEEVTEPVATALADLGIDPDVAATPSDPLAEGGPVDLPSTSLDDATVVQRVRTTLSARGDLRTDDLIVDVVNGVVYLSGALPDPHTFGEVVDLTRETPGVRRVQSLMHVSDESPGTP
jgi:hypothetical protein